MRTKAKEIILLGAGASVEAGVPAAIPMTKEIVKRFNETTGQTDRYGISKDIVNFVLAGLITREAEKGKNPLEITPNVEDLFSALQFLSERNNLDISPFVGAWQSRIEQFDLTEPPPPDTDRLVKTIEEFISSGFRSDSFGLRRSWGASDSRLKRELRDALKSSLPKPANGQHFKRANDEMIEMLRELVWIEGAGRVEYLSPIVELARKQNRLVIASLNYDNAIELLSEASDIACHTGIKTWSETGRFELSDGGINLLKLHGSITWTERFGTRIASGFSRGYTEINPKEKKFYLRTGENRPALIFGQRNKLTAEGPYLDLLYQFNKELVDCTRLTVIGYSFADSHINAFLTKFLNLEGKRLLTIVNPSLNVKYHTTGNSAVDKFLQVAKSSGSKIEIITKFTGAALQDLWNDDQPEIA